jgi:UDPglucose 6-dehydrogenase
MAEAAGYDFGLLKAVIRANEQQTAAMVDKVAGLLGGDVAGSTIAAWGLTFKAGTDDMRQSPAVAILDQLRERGATIRAFDPGVTDVPAGITSASSALAACDGADVLAVLTEWPEFGDVPLDQVARRLNSRRLLDTRNIIDTARLRELWFKFVSVGHHQPSLLTDAA